MASIMEVLGQRLGYKESMDITRDEFVELQNYEAEGDKLCADYKAEIDELEGVQKQLNLAREILDGIIECIDDEGVVTPEDQQLLARRLATAIKFVGNL